MKQKQASLQIVLVVAAVSIALVLVLLGPAATLASPTRPESAPQGGPPPTVVNYQGTLRQDGALYEGTGYFKFAVMDSASGDGTTNYWANDGTDPGEPTAYITLTVTNGLFNVMLGDTSLTGMTEVISNTVFEDTDTYLRVWFSNSPSGFQALAPNQKFTSVPYALRAEYAESYTESDPVFSTSAAATINNTQINNWTTAFNWGNHATIGYDTSDDAWTNAGMTDVTVANKKVGIGVAAPTALLHVLGNTGSGMALFRIQQLGTFGDTYQEFLPQSGVSYSVGVDNLDDNFKITNVPNMTGASGSSQGDGVTMLQADASGIVDFNNQSRARADLNHLQAVPAGAWIPVEFDNHLAPPSYDQHNEFIPWTGPGTPALFQPLVAGYYQVHARTSFEYVEPVQPIPGGYVSIAIFVNTVMVAQGNNLQMMTGAEILWSNNAPNVSDVVWLTPADFLEIQVFQNVDGTGVMYLGNGPSQTYVAIHKDS